ncbi:MAG: hypothetical protein KY412_03150 [Actinobacteria bacterium]|nr:hypothetical protein [Actinomycetota bacterium]
MRGDGGDGCFPDAGHREGETTMLVDAPERVRPRGARSPWALALVAILSLVVAACGNGDSTDADDSTGTTSTSTTSTTTTTTSEDDTTTTTQADGAVLAQSCTNAEAGYGVQFPQGWSTNEGEVVPPCRYFHPHAFEVPEATEVFDLAVTIRVDDVPFTRVTSEEDSLGERVLSREETTVAGHQAVRVEVQSTGDALLPEGVHSYRYHVDVDGGTLTATTHDVGDLDYEANKDIVDQMMETLELDPA